MLLTCLEYFGDSGIIKSRSLCVTLVMFREYYGDIGEDMYTGVI